MNKTDFKKVTKINTEYIHETYGFTSYHEVKIFKWTKRVIHPRFSQEVRKEEISVCI